MKIETINQLNWQKGEGLVPSIIQDADSREVLMLGYMNEDSLKLTLTTRKIHFFSRSRQVIWLKGETSCHYLKLVALLSDCDQDALLFLVEPMGPVCHKKTISCFTGLPDSVWTTLQQMEKRINQRAQQGDENSYTVSLLNSGLNRIAQKVGEEAVETVIAALKENDEQLCNEAADLLYHLSVLFKGREISWRDVLAVIRLRLQT